MPRVLAAAAALVLSSLLTAGCGTDSGSGAAVSASAPLPDRELRTELSQQESDLLYLAEQQLINSCMRKQGFAYQVTAPYQLPSSAAARPFGNDDVALAKAHGYGIANGEQERQDRQLRNLGPNGRYVASLSPQRRQAFQRALDGTNPAAITVQIGDRGSVFTSADGCQADARTQLYGGLRRWTAAKATVINLRALTQPELAEDTRYTTALRSWRSCMTRRGYSYQNPAEAVAAAARKSRPGGGNAALRRQEQHVAVADAQCNRQSALAATGARVQREHVQAAARGHFRQAVSDYTLAVTRALPIARRITKTQ
jgi:predicted small secreted protein